jgi:hypothetical protein
MKIETNTLLPNTKHMVRVAAAFVILAASFGVIVAEYAVNDSSPLFACVVWGLGFFVIFAIIYVLWLIYYAINVYIAQEQEQRMKAFERAINGKPEEE